MESLLDRIFELTLYSFAGNRNEYMRNYMKNRYHQKRNELIKLLGGKCVNCGTTDNLEIDHIDSSKKTFRAADIHSIADDVVKKELDNFQLLCATCHESKTNEKWDRSIPNSNHGTYWKYVREGCRCSECKKAFRARKKKNK